jgi:hypothetical protein
VKETLVFYSIQVKGHLDSAWSEWFEGMTVTPLEHGETLLCGDIVDQAALHGLLSKVRDLGLPLLAVNPGAVREPGASSRGRNGAPMRP